jgi:hypothetical protein
MPPQKFPVAGGGPANPGVETALPEQGRTWVAESRPATGYL